MRALRASKVFHACVAVLAAGLIVTASATGATAPHAVAPLDVTTSRLPGAKLDIQYKAALGATGGTKPYHWSLATGRLPRAMKLSGSGVISGYPQNEGRWAFKVRVTDAAGRTATQALAITVSEPPAPLPLEIWWSLNPEFIANVPVPSVPLHVYRGQEPFTWSVSGAPPGISIDAAGGYLVGSPTLAGSYSTTFGVTDAKGRTASKTYAVRVIGNLKLTGSLPGGRVGAPYAGQVTLEGGDAPFTWSVSGGALPPGLSLSGNGDIAGTPTAAGTYDFEIRVADKWTQTAAVWFRVIIAP